jgi:hypothetical protein
VPNATVTELKQMQFVNELLAYGTVAEMAHRIGIR